MVDVCKWQQTTNNWTWLGAGSVDQLHHLPASGPLQLMHGQVTQSILVIGSLPIAFLAIVLADVRSSMQLVQCKQIAQRQWKCDFVQDTQPKRAWLNEACMQLGPLQSTLNTLIALAKRTNC